MGKGVNDYYYCSSYDTLDGPSIARPARASEAFILRQCANGTTRAQCLALILSKSYPTHIHDTSLCELSEIAVTIRLHTSHGKTADLQHLADLVFEETPLHTPAQHVDDPRKSQRSQRVPPWSSLQQDAPASGSGLAAGTLRLSAFRIALASHTVSCAYLPAPKIVSSSWVNDGLATKRRHALKHIITHTRLTSWKASFPFESAA